MADAVGAEILLRMMTRFSRMEPTDQLESAPFLRRNSSRGRRIQRGGDMQYRLARTAIALLCIISGAATASAQITTGVVSGAVKDEQGAVVPGATVTLVSDTRGTQVADAHTNENGDFVFPNVPGDTYTVEVTLEGFKTLRRAGVSRQPRRSRGRADA